MFGEKVFFNPEPRALDERIEDQMLYKLLAIIVGLLVAVVGYYFIRQAYGYLILGLIDFILYFIHNLASVFIFVLGAVTALITIGEALEKKNR